MEYTHNHEDIDRLNDLLKAEDSPYDDEFIIGKIHEEYIGNRNHEDFDKLRFGAHGTYFHTKQSDRSGTPVPEDPNASTTTITSVDKIHHNNRSRKFFILSPLLAVGGLALLLFVRWISRKRRIQEANRLSPYRYLVNFDSRDVSLTKSVMGGWHGTYQNLLSQGIQRRQYGDSRSSNDDDTKSLKVDRRHPKSKTNDLDLYETEPISQRTSFDEIFFNDVDYDECDHDDVFSSVHTVIV